MFCAVLGLYTLSSVGAGVRTSSVHLGQLSRFYLKSETESSLRNVMFYIKTGRWKMLRDIIFVLMYHRHKRLDLIDILPQIILRPSSRCSYRTVQKSITASKFFFFYRKDGSSMFFRSLSSILTYQTARCHTSEDIITWMGDCRRGLNWWIDLLNTLHRSLSHRLVSSVYYSLHKQLPGNGC
jgi:hypothetical protein